MILLKCNAVTISYPDREQVFRYPDFQLESGQCLCLSGKSGHGKTTLLNALLMPSFSGKISYNCIRIFDRDYADWVRGGGLFRAVSYLPQYSQNSLNPSLTLASQIKMVKKSNQITISHQQLLSYIEELNMTSDSLSKYPHELSGGMRQRAALLLAFVKKPELCFIDEASSAIDYVTQECLVDFLLRRKEDGTGIFCISHHKGMINKLADQIVELKD